MLEATHIRVGHVIRMDQKICKVLSQEMAGTGKFGRTVHLKLKNLEDGHLIEKSVRAEDKVEDVEAHSVKMQYLYRDGDNFIFMNSESFEQFSLSSKVVGRQEIFLKENSEINVLFAEDRALSVDFPKSVELKVVTAPPALKGGNDTTYKEAELENGLKILVPQFVKEGECVRVDVEGLLYLERVTVKSMKSEDRKEK
jgi:elongation factor P